ncbi:MAG: PPC domain-containing protein [Chloroflexota bacterium]|nr:PPC domain-containing protein [Chloroflexota bacterium]
MQARTGTATAKVGFPVRSARLWLLPALIAVVLAVSAVRTQAQTLDFGVTLRGRLDDATPRASYSFDGLRGDVLSLSVTFTGAIDPLVLLAAAESGVLTLPQSLDAAPGRDLIVSSFLVPATDRYTLIVARFGGSIGMTSGEYAITVARVGVSSGQGSVLRYGDSVYSAIDDSTAEVYYSFQAARGDVITVQMQRASGDLDPSLLLVNNRSEVIADNDDQAGSTDAAIRDLTVLEDGGYAIIASRYGGAAGTSRGSFVLTLTAESQSNIGASIAFALVLTPGTPVRGEIENGRSLVFYRFDGARGDLVSLAMTRAGGDLDPLVYLADASGRELVADDDGGGGQNAAIIDFALPANGTYTVGATRFERAAGVTRGAYTLTLQVR